jgi:hypothetical protein
LETNIHTWAAANKETSKPMLIPTAAPVLKWSATRAVTIRKGKNQRLHRARAVEAWPNKTRHVRSSTAYKAVLLAVVPMCDGGKKAMVALAKHPRERTATTVWTRLQVPVVLRTALQKSDRVQIPNIIPEATSPTPI